MATLNMNHLGERGGIVLNRLQHLQNAGVSIWLDDLSRELIDSGELMRLIQERAVTGATSNPAIFEVAALCAGARPQRYSDVRYVQELITPGAINTMPMATVDAFADHGDVGGSVGEDAVGAERLLDELADEDLDLDALTAELERQGVQSFRESYRDLLDSIEERASRLMDEVGDYAHP